MTAFTVGNFGINALQQLSQFLYGQKQRILVTATVCLTSELFNNYSRICSVTIIAPVTITAESKQ